MWKRAGSVFRRATEGVVEGHSLLCGSQQTQGTPGCLALSMESLKKKKSFILRYISRVPHQNGASQA